MSSLRMRLGGTPRKCAVARTVVDLLKSGVATFLFRYRTIIPYSLYNDSISQRNVLFCYVLYGVSRRTTDDT